MFKSPAFRLIIKGSQCGVEECGPMRAGAASLQLGTWPSTEASFGTTQAEFVRGPQVANIHGVRPGREKPIGSRTARVNRRRSHHAARTCKHGGMECNLCPTEPVVPMAGREGPRSNTRDRPGIHGFVSDGCWLLVVVGCCWLLTDEQTARSFFFFFCGQRGIQSGTCPRSLKHRLPSPPSSTHPTDLSPCSRLAHRVLAADIHCSTHLHGLLGGALQRQLLRITPTALRGLGLLHKLPATRPQKAGD